MIMDELLYIVMQISKKSNAKHCGSLIVLFYPRLAANKTLKCSVIIVEHLGCLIARV